MDGRRRVRLLHTGGTLGMTGSPLEPGSYQARLLEFVPELSRLAVVEPRIVANLDSSDLGPPVWSELARIVAEERTTYDGFVIVHGTDTMSYTASALAFALEGLDRPVVMTGAQRPLTALRTDARRNLADAVELATCDLPEVGICFDGLLLRGTRAIKADARHYRAFASPGVEPLARLGTDVHVAPHVRRPTRPFRCDPRFEVAVDVVWVHPGLTPSQLRARMADPLVKGWVVAAFGVGTVPSTGIAEVVAEVVGRGVPVLVTTQWGGTTALGSYRNSEVLRDAGVIEGGEMRIEAAVPKLMHGLATRPEPATLRAWLVEDRAGER